MSTFTLLSDVIELSDDLEAFNDYAMAQGWSDGLPLIPPTETRVERMLQGYERTSESVVAHLPVEDAPCTIEKIAINAVMAGCKPGYMPHRGRWQWGRGAQSMHTVVWQHARGDRGRILIPLYTTG